VKSSANNITFLWRCSHKSVAIVSVTDLDNSTIIEKFWDEAEVQLDKLDPLALMLIQKPEKILGLAVVDGTSYILRVYDIERQKFKTFEFKDWAKDLDIDKPNFQVVSMDKSQRKNIIFVAVQIPDMAARVIQIKIEKASLELVSACSIMIDDFKAFTRITSFQIAKNDYLLCHGTHSLVLIKSKDKSLNVIHVFPNIFVGQVYDSCIYKNRFFTVSPANPFILEITANNKVDDKDVVAAPEEISYEKYNVTKIPITAGKFDRLDINRNTNVLYLVGRGMLAVTDLHLAKPVCLKSPLESKRG
jgi:hypothetical protein